MLRTGATFVVRSLLALLAVCCCTISALAQDGKTYWQVHTGGGAAMSLEGGTLRFAEQIGRVAVGTVYFSGQRSGRSIRGVFSYSLTQVSRCPPVHSGELILSEDGRSFTLTNGAVSNPERVSGCSEPTPNSSVIRGDQIHWPSRQVVAAIAPPVIARVPDVAPPAKAVEKAVQAITATPRAWFAIGVPDKTEPVLVVLFLLAVWWFLVRDNSVGWFVTRLVKWVALRLALVGVVVVLLLAPISWVEQQSDLIRTEGSFFHWLRLNVSIPVATVLNRIAPYCGTSLLSTPAGAYSSFATFENVLPPPHGSRCEASIAALVKSVLSFNVSTLTGWIASAWAWVYAAFAWVFGVVWGWMAAAWAWVSAPFVWIFSPVSGVLWWLATPFINFFWLVYTLIDWLFWLVHQLIIWMAWAVWIAGAWGVWLLRYFVYYLAIALQWGGITIGSLLWSGIGYLALGLVWFAINVGNYVIAIVVTVTAFFVLAARGGNPLSDWVEGYIGRDKAELNAKKQAEADAKNADERRKAEERKKAADAAEYARATGVLGFSAWVQAGVIKGKEAECRAMVKALRIKHHPDRIGGSLKMAQDIADSWNIFCKNNGWTP